MFAEHKIDACIHLAGLKVVGESVESWSIMKIILLDTCTCVRAV